ncbi:MAG: EAL domain-containing protein, partial [Pseudomonadota bacterium]
INPKPDDGRAWHWDPATGRLNIASGSGDFSDLQGAWSLSGVQAVLEGFSRARLGAALGAGEGVVDCPLTLSNGRRARFAGRFNADGTAHGQLHADDVPGDLRSGPGPDLKAAFQPIVSLNDGRVAGFEALARWPGADGGPSARFEDEALASNMLIQAADALALWRDTGHGQALFVQVNLTGRDLARNDLPHLIEALVAGHRLPAGALRVELTEQAALRDAGAAVDAIKAIKAAGAGVVLDDFGTGHSSFAWLADIPADGLKVDQDLIARGGTERGATILQAITLLARRLDMTATAEGVESKSDAAHLRTLGFDYAQGFAFAHPLNVTAAMMFLLDQARPEPD